MRSEDTDRDWGQWNWHSAGELDLINIKGIFKLKYKSLLKRNSYSELELHVNSCEHMLRNDTDTVFANICKDVSGTTFATVNELCSQFSIFVSQNLWSSSFWDKKLKQYDTDCAVLWVYSLSQQRIELDDVFVYQTKFSRKWMYEI